MEHEEQPLTDYRINMLEEKISAHLKDCAEYRKEANARFFKVLLVLVATLAAAVSNLIVILAKG